MTLIEELQQAATRVLEVAGPATVRIGQGRGRGAGVVVAPGFVLTNAHNLRDRTTTVSFPDGRAEQGSVQGIDPVEDLAVLAVDTGDAVPVAWAPVDTEVAIGTMVFSVASPPSGGSRVTWGAVSGVGRSFRGPRGRVIRDGIEHTAPVRRGSSGGPLLDTAGQLVGLNTHRLGDGFYLAQLSSPTLHERVDALVQGESPHRHHLGVAIAPSHAARRMREAVGLEARDGLLVRGVERESPADLAGIRRGDLLVEAGGAPLHAPDDLFTILDATEAAESLTIRLVRANEETEVLVSFASAAAEPAADPEAPA